jgi:hypothetical protein
LISLIAAVARADVIIDDPPVANLPDAGFVPTADVAIAIAVAIWKPIYGNDRIAHEKPYHAELINNRIWVVSGSLPPGISGDAVQARILRSDGRIMGVAPRL